MNFQVPQFIEIEDKIFGPLTFKQFVYLAGGAGLAFLIYTVKIPLMIKAVPMLLILGLAFALAFYKINNRPFIIVVEAALKYLICHKLYLWQKRPPETLAKPAAAMTPADQNLPKLSKSRLEELAWSLDVHKNVQ